MKKYADRRHGDKDGVHLDHYVELRHLCIVKTHPVSIFTSLFYTDNVTTHDASASAKKKKTGNMWTRSKNFKKLTDWAFKTIDADGSGQVDKKELYTGLLMIHLKLATYAGPAACRPATREYCEKIFDQMDVDKSGELDREEFTEVMQIVCAQVFTRVTIQWTMTLMIVPMSKLLFVGLSQFILLRLSRPILFSHVHHISKHPVLLL